MNKVLILSDLHLGVYKSSIEYEIIHRNLLNKIIKDSLQKGCKNVFILGDFFHEKTEIGTNILKLGNEILDLLSKNFERVFILAGNHDFYFKENSSICALNELKSIKNDNIITIINKPLTFNINTRKVVFLPWHKVISDEDINKFLSEKYDVLCSHLPINDFNVTNTIKEEVGFSRKLISKISKISIHGHFHTHQQIDNLIYIGSQLHLSKNDRNVIKYYGILDLKTLKLEKIVTNKWFPNFIRILDLENLENFYFNNANVEIILSSLKIESFTQEKYNKIYEYFKLLNVDKIKIFFANKSIDKNHNILNLEIDLSLKNIFKKLIQTELKSDSFKITEHELINYFNLLMKKL